MAAKKRKSYAYDVLKEKVKEQVKRSKNIFSDKKYHDRLADDYPKRLGDCHFEQHT